MKIVGSSSSAHAFYPRLQALRGIAALSVAAFHCWQGAWRDLSGHVHIFLVTGATDNAVVRIYKMAARMASNGSGAVIIFFVLSGFVLAGSLAHGHQRVGQSAKKFFIARFFRIYPAIVWTVFVFAAVFWFTGATLPPATSGSFSPRGLLENTLLLDVSIDGVMWSLQLEVLAVPIVFLAYLAYQRWGSAALSILCVILMALSFSSTWQHAISGVQQFGLVFAFIPGMMAYFLGERLVGRLSARIARWILVIAIISFLATRPVIGVLSNWSVILESLLGALVIALLAFSNINRRNLILDHSIVRFYGKISYSFYLLHPLSLVAIAAMPVLLGTGIHTTTTEACIAFGLFVGSTLAVTPLAFASYRWIERPGISFGRTVATTTPPPKAATAIR